MQRSVDAGVAGDHDLALHVLIAQVTASGVRGRVQVVGDPVDHLPVAFLWKRRGAIVRAQTCLDVGDLDAAVEGRERAGERGRRVTLDDDPLGRTCEDVEQSI